MIKLPETNLFEMKSEMSTEYKVFFNVYIYDLHVSKYAEKK